MSNMGTSSASDIRRRPPQASRAPGGKKSGTGFSRFKRGPGPHELKKWRFKKEQKPEQKGRSKGAGEDKGPADRRAFWVSGRCPIVIVEPECGEQRDD